MCLFNYINFQDTLAPSVDAGPTWDSVSCPRTPRCEQEELEIEMPTLQLVVDLVLSLAALYLRSHGQSSSSQVLLNTVQISTTIAVNSSASTFIHCQCLLLHDFSEHIHTQGDGHSSQVVSF